MKRHTVCVAWRGMRFEATGLLHEMERGRDYMPNGDPGYPAEPAHFEIEELSLIDGEGSARCEAMLDLVVTETRFYRDLTGVRRAVIVHVNVSDELERLCMEAL